MDLRFFGALVFAYALLETIHSLRQNSPWRAWGAATAIGFATMIEYVVAAMR